MIVRITDGDRKIRQLKVNIDVAVLGVKVNVKDGGRYVS